MREVIDYVISFLLHGNDHLLSQVGYTSDVTQFNKYKVVIIPSPFFDEDVYGTLASEPQLPLTQVEDSPLLFGSPEIEQIGQTKVVHADIVASTFFLITRYEELLHAHDHRDEHGRYIGQQSLPYRAGFLQRPIVDEYGDLLLKWLAQAGCEVNSPKREYAHIVLTHDVDALNYYRRLRGFLGGIKRNILSINGLESVFKALLSIENDPAYQFPWMLKEDAQVASAQKIYFLKAALRQHHFDYPNDNLFSSDMRNFIKLLRDNDCQIGLHTSYYSAENLTFVAAEKKKLEKALGCSVEANRWHYLRTLQPTDFAALQQSGITDDYTLGYADVAGFRLGTCRVVRWINPLTCELTDLQLHPLTVMDCTLDRPNYMNLSEEEAFAYACQLLQQVKQHNGEVVLLWHNTSFCNNSYHRSLYSRLLSTLHNAS